MPTPPADRPTAAPGPLAGAVPIATVRRGGVVESAHLGHVVLVGPDGAVLGGLGDPDVLVLPRSSLKPVQALAMLRSGLRLGGDLLALATASHSGEDFHREGARRVLASVGLDEGALRNTPDLPSDPELRARWQAEGRSPERLAQNCSGKHAAMLATCVAAGWSTEDYLDPGHPLQRAVLDAVRELTGADAAGTGELLTTDGCGTPLPAVPLSGLARAFSRLATAERGTPGQALAQAVRDFPVWVGGTRRDVTALLRGVPGLIAKDGAEAVYAAALPDGRAVALKVLDGGDRARPVAMAAALRALGVDAPVVAEQATAPVLGHGEPVGEVRGVDVPLLP
ncbi:asparaginase [Pseudokineococcus marinus]|uniref:Asparaginase n=1 Tax=Pseudokineococcus marinus TaxID=351215 RepID=A0A849BUC9_9ACTN|nr:asparaginase [Pseudokineococcus marinus]NNH24557.1 asparaginase [Pseudokineococcus marinus]